jgi:hypothetical protein
MVSGCSFENGACIELSGGNNVVENCIFNKARVAITANVSP